jgi:hypothetical protein
MMRMMFPLGGRLFAKFYQEGPGGKNDSRGQSTLFHRPLQFRNMRQQYG